MGVKEHVEPSECSKVAKMFLADTFVKELVQGGGTRRSVRENIFEELRRSDACHTRHDGLRNCASDLGRMLVDSGSRPLLPSSLIEAPRDDFELPTPASSRTPQRGVVDRVSTPFRWSDTPAISPKAPTPPDYRSDGMRLPEDSRWPSPAIGRQFKIPAPPVPLSRRTTSSRGQSRTGTAMSQSMPTLNLAPQNAQLAATLAKMKKVKADPSAHLRRCAVQMGVPTQTTTTYMKQSAGPVAMAVDPKWSTDLKKIDFSVGQKLKFYSRLSGAGTTISPELRYLPRDFEDGFVPKALPKAL